MQPTNHPFKRKMIFQTSMIMFHVNIFRGVPQTNISVLQGVFQILLHPVQIQKNRTIWLIITRLHPRNLTKRISRNDGPAQKCISNQIWGFPKMVVPNNHGFPTKNDHFGALWGYHHLRKHSYGYFGYLCYFGWSTYPLPIGFPWFSAGCLSPMSAEKVFSKSGDEPRTLPP